MRLEKQLVCAFSLAVLLTILAMLVIAPWDLEIALSFVRSGRSGFGQFIQDWGRTPAKPLIVGAALVLVHRPFRVAHPGLVRAAAALLVHFVLHPGLLTNLLKPLVGRTRPVHLGPDGSGFTSFLSLQPGIGDFSFPSGHVAATMVIAPCILLLWRLRWRKTALALGCMGAAWAGAVALGRVVHGAHFVTDVVFSIGVGIALAPASLDLGDRFVTRITRGDAVG